MTGTGRIVYREGTDTGRIVYGVRIDSGRIVYREGTDTERIVYGVRMDTGRFEPELCQVPVVGTQAIQAKTEE